LFKLIADAGYYVNYESLRKRIQIGLFGADFQDKSLYSLCIIQSFLSRFWVSNGYPKF